METLKHEWTNSKGDKLVFTGKVDFELNSQGEFKTESKLRRLVQELKVNGEDIFGYVRDLEKSHPLYKVGARATFGKFAITEKDLNAINDIMEILKKSEEYQTSQKIKNNHDKMLDKYCSEKKAIEEMSAGGELCK